MWRRGWIFLSMSRLGDWGSLCWWRIDFVNWGMKIAVVQMRSVKGDIAANIERHKELISLALEGGADAVFFPELSITGYEPGLAAALAAGPDDTRLDVFQSFSDERTIIIGVGMPVRMEEGVGIGMIIFQ